MSQLHSEDKGVFFFFKRFSALLQETEVPEFLTLIKKKKNLYAKRHAEKSINSQRYLKQEIKIKYSLEMYV